MVEGVRVHRQLPGSRLLLSGGAVFDPVPEMVTMAAVARVLETDDAEIIIEADSLDTGEQAKRIRNTLRHVPFLLEPCCPHSKGDVVFRKPGMMPVPAPVAISDVSTGDLSPFPYFPGRFGSQTRKPLGTSTSDCYGSNLPIVLEARDEVWLFLSVHLSENPVLTATSSLSWVATSFYYARLGHAPIWSVSIFIFRINFLS